MTAPRILLHRFLRSLGLHVQQWRDPYVDAARMLRGTTVKHVIDGGAFHGAAARRMLEQFPSATVHAFEPQEETVGYLKQSLAGEPRFQLNQLALSDRSGNATLHVNQKAYTTSLLETAEPQSMRPHETRQIPTVSLDAWAKERGISDVPFIKLDLQGHELAALRGAEELLSSSVDVVLTEVNFRERYVGTCLFQEVDAYLHSRGLRFFRFYEIINGPDGDWQLADALFVRPSRRMPRGTEANEK